jgi:hypothetical protein
MQSSLATRRSRIARPISWLVVAGLAGAALIGPGAGGVAAAADYATVTGHAPASAESNNPDFWGDNCTKIDAVDGNLGDAYVLTQSYALVVVKAGAGEFANTLFANPTAGQTVWADTNGDNVFNPGGQDGDKNISHIIFCGPVETTTTSSESSSTSSVESTTSSVESTTSTQEISTTSTVASTTAVQETTSSSSDGEVLGVEGTPNVTLPPTSTLDAATTSTGSPDALRIVLLGLAVLLASILLLQPKGATSRK